MCAHTWRLQVSFGYLSQLLPALFIQTKFTDSVSPALIALGSPRFSLLGAGTMGDPPCSSSMFTWAFRGLNTGPHVCATSTLSTEPSPQALEGISNIQELNFWLVGLAWKSTEYSLCTFEFLGRGPSGYMGKVGQHFLTCIFSRVTPEQRLL